MLPEYFSKPSIALLLTLFLNTWTTAVAHAQSQDTSVPVGASVIETGILQNAVGFTDVVLGAEVIAITPAENNTLVIDVVIPVNPDDVDLIRVVTPDGNPLKQYQPMEISMDHENKEVSVILKIVKKDKLGFKFRLIDLPEDQ